jgi:drug/metabolite transporter (DMT)-like permease
MAAPLSKHPSQTRMSEKKKAYAFILLGVLCIGTGPIFVKFISAPGSLIAFYRLLFASLILTLPVLIRNRKQSIVPSRKVILAAILGGVAFSINVALWVTALSMTTASKVTLLDNTAPIWVGLIGWLLMGKRESGLYWIGLLVTFVGAGLMIDLTRFQFNSQQGLGDLLAVLCGFTYALYLLLTSRIRARMDSITYSWILACSGTVTLLIFNWMMGYLIQPVSAYFLLLIFAMAISSQVLGWILINQALGMLPVAHASVILLGQPIVATLLGIWILSEIPTPLQAVGGIICLVGIFLVQRSNMNQQR